MNCPKCEKKPVGMFHSFRLGGVSFNKRMKGFFKCRHCGAVLRQKRTSMVFPRYRKQFWMIYPLVIVLFAVFSGFLVTFVPQSVLGFWGTAAVLIFAIIAMLGVADEIRSRYWIIEEKEPVKAEKKAATLTKTGWAVFLAYFVVVVALFLGTRQYIEVLKVGLTAYLIGYILFLTGVLGGAVVILHKFSR